MVDPVIDEHFRRSLGADYMNLFGKRLNQLKTTTSSASIKSPQISPVPETPRPVDVLRPDDDETAKRDNDKEMTVEENVNIEMSVDDHFAKALGDTWKQLQQNKSRASPIEPDLESDVTCDSMNNSNTNDDERSSSPKNDSTHNSCSES